MKLRSSICYSSAILSAVTYITFTLLACELYPLPVSPFQNWLSDLGDPMINSAGAVFYNVGVTLSAFFLAVWFTAGLSQWRMNHDGAQPRLLLISEIAGILAAFAMIMSALYPINRFEIHAFWSRIHFMMFGVGFGFSVASLRYHHVLPKIALYVGASASVMPTLMLVFGNSYWLEWIAVGCIIAYVLSVGRASLRLKRSQNGSVPDQALADAQNNSL